jgi:hypothetical protein
MSNSAPPATAPPTVKTQDVNPFAAKAAEEAANAKIKKTSLLDTVITGKKVRPIFCVITGAPGVGKSTFASKAPEPVFLDIERGVDQIGSARFPTPTTYLEFAMQLDALDKEEHSFQSIVVDTFDALEPLIVQRTCEDLKVASIEKLDGGAGYIHAKGLWRKLLIKLRTMSERFNIILIGHSSVKPFNDPALPAPYDTWKFRINEKCADAIKESVDTILYACLDVTLTEGKTKKVGRAIPGEVEHIMHTQPAPGYEAKNRFNLPDPMPLEWLALQASVEAFYKKS